MTLAVLEDEFGDIIRKARVGLGKSTAQVAEAVGIEQHDLEAFESYEKKPSPDVSNDLAEELSLNARALWAIATDAYVPEPMKAFSEYHLQIFSFPGMDSRGYILHVRATGDTLLIDPGGNPHELLKALDQSNLTLTGILLTHGHHDHVDGLEGVLDGGAKAPVFAHSSEWKGGRDDIETIDLKGRKNITVGRTIVDLLACPGHTPFGLTFVVGPFAFVGDTLFAGSLGGAYQGPLYYDRLLASAHQLMDLAPTTVLLPGHGPPTTVAQERRYNAFLAEEA